jgi:hypothetical protein
MNKMIAIAGLALSMAASAQASTVYFSESATTPTVGAPAIALNALPGATVNGSLYAWINVTTEGYAGISLNIGGTQVGGGSITGSLYTQTNTNPGGSTRWDTFTASTLNTSGNLLTNSGQAAVAGGSGINATSVGYPASTPDAGTGDYRLFKFDYSIVAPNVASTVYSLFFERGSSNWSVVSGGNLVSFGTAGDNVQVAGAGSTAGTASALADAVITVTAVPEPASIGLASVVALGLLARRRRTA